MPAQQMLSDRYELCKEIGRGGMGCVWLAHDRLLDRPVAIKEMHPQLQLSEDSRTEMYRRVEREARYAASIDHPSLVTVYDVVVTQDGRPWIVMQYLKLETLHDYVQRKGRLSVPEVIKIARNLFDVLGEVHAKGIIHRDIKPSNILVRLDGTIVLLDFGIAKRSQDTALTGTGMMIGSTPFMAPERFMDSAEVGFASDLWAAGLVLYYALTGESLFQRDTNEAMWYAILNDSVPMHSIRGPLANLVDGLLNKNAAKRLTLVEAQQLLKEAIAVTERRTTTVARPVIVDTQQQKRRRLALAMALFALVGGGLVAFIITRSNEKQPSDTYPSASPSSGSPAPYASSVNDEQSVSAPSATASSSPSESQNLRPHLVTVKGGKRVYSDYQLSFVVPSKWKVLDTTDANEVQLEASSGNTYSVKVLGTSNLKDTAEQLHSAGGTIQNRGDITYERDDYATWDFTALAYNCGSFCPAGTRIAGSEQVRRTESGKLIEVAVTQNTLLPKGVTDDSDQRQVELTQFSSRVSTT